MLTDYHLHLRPDEDGTTFERYFTSENVERYLDAAAAAGIEELGVSEHVYRFRQALDLWQHPLWVENAVDDLDAYCEFVRGTPLRLGIECDYIPGAEDRTAALLEARDLDYVVGSVHFIGEGDAAIDHKGFDVWEGNGDADEIWRRYFEQLAACARSGLFDILAHPDLVKVWGRATPQPERDPRAFYERRERGRGRDLYRRAPQAGRRALSLARVRRDVRRGGRPLRPLLRRAPARTGRLRVRPGGLFPGGTGDRRDMRLRAAPAEPRAPGQPGPLTVVGLGYDSHRFVPGRRLVLGGVEIEHDQGLEGHSDADVLTHAVIDALLGANGGGDIGEMFPDDDPAFKDADSIDLLRTVVGTIAGPIVNIDATLICEQPRLGSYKAEMERILAEATSARVSVKATSNEGMGFVGRGEGIACIAVASVESE
jgi:2-C-methyl-D-erythritol 2,4-cyclodiphosphate synthase